MRFLVSIIATLGILWSEITGAQGDCMNDHSVATLILQSQENRIENPESAVTQLACAVQQGVAQNNTTGAAATSSSDHRFT